MRKAILAILLTTILFAGTAFATLGIDNETITCRPINTATGTCSKNSKFFLDFQLYDSNTAYSIADGNLQGWTIKVNYGPPSNAKQNSLTVNDTNLVKTSVCDSNFGSTTTTDDNRDSNFFRSRYCSFLLTGIPTGISNGTYAMDVNVNEYSGHGSGDGNITSDLNTTILFTINNQTVTSGALSVINLLSLVLAAVAALVMIAMFAMGKVTGVTLVISMIIIAIATVVFVMIFSPMVNVLTV